MKEYDILGIGSGAAISVVSAWLDHHPQSKVALIDKDTPGGICLTRGCIPSKMLTSVADVLRTVQRSEEFGVSVTDPHVDFAQVMRRLRNYIDPKIEALRDHLSNAPNLDYFHEPVEFVGPSTLRTGHGVELYSPRILLGLGSEPIVPDIPGLRDARPLTTDEVFDLSERPERMAILGGGYIAAEFAHFFSAMGTNVTVVGRNPRFLPQEEPEISEIVARNLSRRVRLLLGRRPDRVEHELNGEITLHLPASGRLPAEAIRVDRVLVAAGRGPTSRALHPERSGVRTDARGWIVVNNFLETSHAGIWALGDATGRFPFKHKANYDAKVLFHSIVHGRRTAVDYHAIPHAVFTDPEVAAVGLTESAATEKFGEGALLVGRCEYADTAKGYAIGAMDGRVKVIVRRGSLKIVGAHVVGPQASVLIQEVVTLLYTAERSARPIIDGMHIHPALSEVVERAFLDLRPPHKSKPAERSADSRITKRRRPAPRTRRKPRSARSPST